MNCRSSSWPALDVEQLGRANVRIAISVAGVDRGEVNRCRNLGGLEVLTNDEPGVHVTEASADLRHARVTDREPDAGVVRVDGPVADGKGERGGRGIGQSLR